MKPRTAAATGFDFIVIGSGFGGSVSALRLTEKGYRVAVMEMDDLFLANVEYCIMQLFFLAKMLVCMAVLLYNENLFGVQMDRMGLGLYLLMLM